MVHVKHGEGSPPRNNQNDERSGATAGQRPRPLQLLPPQRPATAAQKFLRAPLGLGLGRLDRVGPLDVRPLAGNNQDCFTQGRHGVYVLLNCAGSLDHLQVFFAVHAHCAKPSAMQKLASGRLRVLRQPGLKRREHLRHRRRQVDLFQIVRVGGNVSVACLPHGPRGRCS